MIVEFPNMRFQTAPRLEVSQTMFTLVFEAHQVGLNMGSHVTFLFYFFMTLTAAPDQRAIRLGLTLIHQTVQLGVKFCKKISQISVSDLTLTHQTLHQTYSLTSVLLTFSIRSHHHAA